MTDLLNGLAHLTSMLLIPGLAYGSQLALGALGVTLIFGVLRFSSFAHAEGLSLGTALTILITLWLQGMGVSLGFCLPPFWACCWPCRCWPWSSSAPTARFTATSAASTPGQRC